MDEDIEPYVRRKKGEGTSRRKMETLNEDVNPRLFLENSIWIQEQNVLRNAINSRERKRMHELNDEFDALRYFSKENLRR